jgi:hypothetical protein
MDRLIVDRPHPWGAVYLLVGLRNNKGLSAKRPEFEETIKSVFKSLARADNGDF